MLSKEKQVLLKTTEFGICSKSKSLFSGITAAAVINAASSTYPAAFCFIFCATSFFHQMVMHQYKYKQFKISTKGENEYAFIKLVWLREKNREIKMRDSRYIVLHTRFCRFPHRSSTPAGRRFAAALLPRLFGKNPRSHHKGATGRVRTGDLRLPALCHCQLGQDILYP